MRSGSREQIEARTPTIRAPRPSTISTWSNHRPNNQRKRWTSLGIVAYLIRVEEAMNGRSCAGRLSCATGPSLIGLTVAGVLMSRLLLTDEPPMAYCPHCGQPMKLMSVSRLLGRSYPTLLELYCASCDHEEIKEDRPTVRAE